MPAFSGVAGFAGGQVQAGAAEDAAKLQRDIFRQTRSDAEPFRLLGTDAANFLRALFFGEGPSAGLFETGQGRVENPELARLRQELADTPPVIEAPFRTRREDELRGTRTAANPRFNELQRLIAEAPQFIQQGSSTGALDFGEVVQNFDPTFGFRQEQGENAINRALASRGLFRSGRALKALDEFNTNLALGASENFLNRLASFAGLGQTTAATLGNQGITSGALQGNFLLDEAAARASSFNAIGNAFANASGGFFLGRRP
ncbi:MAG: hypothetical protein ACR2RF_00360 [Geminicoccaceae bacterium]